MLESPLLERLRRRFWWQIGDPLDRALGGALRRRINAGRSYAPIFVCGAMGGGTSLLAVQLGQRFECAGVAYESANDLPRDSFLHLSGPEAFPDVASYLEALRPGADWRPELGREALLDLYRASVWRRGDAVIDKGPNANLVRAGFLARCFPEARFVLIFRDPAANIEGFRRKWPSFGAAPIAQCVDFWSQIHRAFLSASARFASRSWIVDYADLVARNEATLAALASRLGLRAANVPRRLRARGNLEGRGIRNVSGRDVGVVDDADARARARLGDLACTEIDTALAPLLSELRSSPRRVGKA